MPPCSLHHSIMAATASPISLDRPGADGKPRSSPNPMVMASSVTPWSVAPLASPGPHGDGSVPNVELLEALSEPPAAVPSVPERSLAQDAVTSATARAPAARRPILSTFIRSYSFHLSPAARAAGGGWRQAGGRLCGHRWAVTKEVSALERGIGTCLCTCAATGLALWRP